MPMLNILHKICAGQDILALFAGLEAVSMSTFAVDEMLEFIRTTSGMVRVGKACLLAVGVGGDEENT